MIETVGLSWITGINTSYKLCPRCNKDQIKELPADTKARAKVPKKFACGDKGISNFVRLVVTAN